MIVAEAQMNIRAVQEIVDAVNKSNAAFESRANAIMVKYQDKIYKGLRDMDPPPARIFGGAYPLRWTSERQRKAFFATDGFGGGIPHRRQSPSQVQRGWRAEYERKPFTGVLIVSNEWDKAPFVIGTRGRTATWQQQFHVDLGWPTFRDITNFTDYWIGQSSNELEQAFIDLATLPGLPDVFEPGGGI